MPFCMCVYMHVGSCVEANVSVCVCLCCHIYVEAGEQLSGVNLSFYCAGSREGRQVLRLLYLLSCPSRAAPVRSHTVLQRNTALCSSPERIVSGRLRQAASPPAAQRDTPLP